MTGMEGFRDIWRREVYEHMFPLAFCRRSKSKVVRGGILASGSRRKVDLSEKVIGETLLASHDTSVTSLELDIKFDTLELERQENAGLLYVREAGVRYELMTISMQDCCQSR